MMDWVPQNEKLPPLGKEVMVLGSMKTKAKLVSVDPLKWEQLPGAESYVQIGAWRDDDSAGTNETVNNAGNAAPADGAA